jgi:hypothetical protein
MGGAQKSGSGMPACTTTGSVGGLDAHRADMLYVTRLLLPVINKHQQLPKSACC